MHTHSHPSTLTLAPAPSPYVLTLNLICFLSSYPFPPVSHLPHPCPASPSLFSLSPVSLTASLISLTLPLPCLYYTLSIMALPPSPSIHCSIYTQEDNRQGGKDTNTMGDTTQIPMTQETMTELVECNTTSTRL